MDVSRQISGPSMLSGNATVSREPAPGCPSTSWPTHAATRSGRPTGAVHARGRQPGPHRGQPHGWCRATRWSGRSTSRASRVSTASPTIGGPDASWIIRWTFVTPGQTGNGHIYYAGMDNNGVGGTPSFFVGDTQCIPLTRQRSRALQVHHVPADARRCPAPRLLRRGDRRDYVQHPSRGRGQPGAEGHAVQRHRVQRHLRQRRSRRPRSSTSSTRPPRLTTSSALPATSVAESPLTRRAWLAGVAALGVALVRRRRGRRGVR